jgi:hypothetical protein
MLYDINDTLTMTQIRELLAGFSLLGPKLNPAAVPMVFVMDKVILG